MVAERKRQDEEVVVGGEGHCWPENKRKWGGEGGAERLLLAGNDRSCPKS